MSLGRGIVRIRVRALGIRRLVSARLVTLPTPRGAVAWAPKSWGDDVDLVLVDAARREPFVVCGSYAVVDVCGPLFLGDHWCCDTYGAIKERLSAAAASASSEVLLRIASPGGDFQGCLDTAREIRAMMRAAGKRLCAFSEAQCSSAAYALATAADELVITESAVAGSIGVWLPVVDETERAKSMGIRVEIVASGDAKTDRNPMVAITSEALARTRAQVDDMARLFFELVAEHRGMSVASVQALDGAELMGVRAVAVGLADRISTLDQLVKSAPNGGARMGARSRSMGARAASKYVEEARVALRRMAESDNEEDKKMAEKALKALEPEKPEPKPEEKPEPSSSDGGGEPTEEEKKKRAAAAAEEEDKRMKEEEQARAAGPAMLALHRELHMLKAKDAERDARDFARAKAEKESGERAALFAKRPDFGPAIRETFAKLPIAELRAAVEGPKAWPRVHVQPGHSLNALTAPVSGGEDLAGGYVPRLSAYEQSLLDKSAPGRRKGPAKAEVIGTHMVVDYYDKETAKARAAELEKQVRELR